MSPNNMRDDEIRSGSEVSGSTEKLDAPSGFRYIDDDPGFKLDELMEQYRPSHISPAGKKKSDARIDDLFNMVESSDEETFAEFDGVNEDAAETDMDPVPDDAAVDAEPIMNDAADDPETVDVFDDGTFIETADDVIESVEEAADDVIDGVKDEAEDYFGNASDAFDDAFDDAIDEATEKAEDAFDSFGDTIEFIPSKAAADEIEEAADAVIESAEEAADEVIDGVKDEAEDYFENASDAFDDAFDDAIDEATEKAEDAFDSFGDTIEFIPSKAAADEIEEAADEVIESVEETADEVIESVEETADEVFETVEDMTGETANEADVIIGDGDGVDDIRLDMTLDDLLLELDGEVGDSESKPYPNEVFDDDADTDAEVSMDDVAISLDAYTDDRGNNDADSENDTFSDASDGGETADENNEVTDNNSAENTEPDESGDPVKYEDVVIDDFFSEKISRYGDIPFEDVFLDEPMKKNEDSYLFEGIRLDPEAAVELGEDEPEEETPDEIGSDLPLDDVKLDDIGLDDEMLGDADPDEAYDGAAAEADEPTVTADMQPEPRVKMPAYDAEKDDDYFDDDIDDETDEPESVGGDIPETDESDGDNADAGAQNIDSTDINLLVAFGLEDELEKTMGTDAARKVRKAIDAEQEEHDDNKRREFEYEFSDRSQIPGIVEAYKSTKKSTLIKLGIAAFLALIIFFFENLPLFGVQFSGALDPAVYPVVYTMVGLQLLLLCCACAYEQILGGFAKLFTGHPCPESITSVLVLMAVIYSALVAIKVEAGYEPKLYNFPVAIAVLFILLLAYLNIGREMYSFSIVASKAPKYAVKRKRVDDITLFGGDAEEEANDVLEVKRVSFIKSYFARTYADSSVVSATVTIIISLALAAAALIGVYVGITTANVIQTLEAVFMTLVVAAPVSLLVTYSYPFFCANKKANGDNATIIGESSLEEYSDASVVVVDDKIVFPTTETKIQNIRIYNNNRIDSVLYYVSSVFAKAGGPLADMFKLSTVETGTSADVKITENAVGCLAAVVDGHKVVLGRVHELSERGFYVDPAITAEDMIMTEENVVMYMFTDGKLAAKMFIRYGISPDFPEIAESLADNGMSLCIITSDPNIDDEIVSARMPIDEFPAKVIKLPVGYERDASDDELDSGIVSRGTADSLLRTVTYCSKILSVRKTNFSIAIFSLFVGVAVMLLLALLGKLTVMSSLLVVLYQLVWTIPVAITSRLFIK